jgi:hypothetical protein
MNFLIHFFNLRKISMVPYIIVEGPAPRVLMGEGLPREITDEDEQVNSTALNRNGRTSIRVTQRW